MGVYGLTSYLRENQRHLSTSFTHYASSPEQLKFVVDGWSFIYHLAYSLSLPWVYGGEYNDFYQAVRRTVKAWLSLDIKSYFVFDGALPEAKIPTKSKRLTENFVTPSLLFFRTSQVARSTPRFLAESFVPPSHQYYATLQALYSLSGEGVEVIFADDEADNFAVELAGQVGSYVLSNDSDFVVLNCDGYLGYIPFSDLTWITESANTPMTSPGDEAQPVDFEALGFKPVQKSKRRKRPAEEIFTRLVPPDDVIGISGVVFSPAMLAAQLHLQPSLLPLLGSLVGNDITNVFDPARYFYERHLAPSQRISKVNGVLQSLLHPSKLANRVAPPPASGMELIHGAISKLFLRPDIVTSRERVEVENQVIEATLQYAISPGHPIDPSFVCTVHESDQCPLVLLHDLTPSGLDKGRLTQRAQVRDAYVNAYRTGRFSADLLNIIGSATIWPSVCLEDPDKTACQVSMGRDIRRWIYSLLELVAGIPRFSIEKPEPVRQDEYNSEEELIDVVENYTDDEDEDVDSVIQIGSAIRRLSVTDSTPSCITNDSGVDGDEDLFPLIVKEYVRKGTRVTDVPVEVPSFDELHKSDSPLLPQLRPVEERIKILSAALHCDDESLLRYSQSLEPLVIITLQFVVRVLGNHDNAADRWTKREALCLLLCFLTGESSEGLFKSDSSPEIHNRHIQLTAQFLSAYQNVIWLVESLLLTDVFPNSIVRFSGMRFHSLLCLPSLPAYETQKISESWQICQMGLDNAWGIERGARGKRERRKRRDAIDIDVAEPTKKHSSARKGLFAALQDIDTT